MSCSRRTVRERVAIALLSERSKNLRAAAASRSLIAQCDAVTRLYARVAGVWRNPQLSGLFY
jgi:hypothetical protein